MELEKKKKKTNREIRRGVVMNDYKNTINWSNLLMKLMGEHDLRPKIKSLKCYSCMLSMNIYFHLCRAKHVF